MSITTIIYVALISSIQTVVALGPNTTVSGEITTQNPDPKQGWTPQPNGRGTIDIIWSCMLTMTLCSWSILCMNMPGPKETRLQILWRKFSLTALGVLCPELIFELALGQWLSARQSVRDFNPSDSGNKRWTMKDAYFADMGGFILHTRDQLPFPLDSKQLHYLVSKQRLSLPVLDHRVIQDKNKVDGLLRTITLCQITWFVINVVARWAQELVVTTAELTTCSFILCSLGTAFCWWDKPADAVVAEVLETDICINDVLQTEGQTPEAWKHTPLDFASRKEWWWSKCWSNFVNILNKMHLTFGSDVTPIDRIADTLQKELTMKPMWICMGLTVGYFSVLFAGWKSSFPSRTEQMLWRAACVTLMATLCALMFFAQVAGSEFALHLPQSLRRCSASRIFRTKNDLESGRRRKRLNNALDRIRNNSAGKDPLLYIPLKIILPMYIIAVFYCHARTYILVADGMGLRSLPASAYATVDWQKFWPHFG
ncbi:hypothetical protein BDR22DRAFT_804948 [Usnea florida]